MNSVTAHAPALVVASFGRRGLLQTSAGERADYIVKGRRLRVVCGDWVLTEPQASSAELLVVDVEARRNCLERPDSNGQTELLAANLDKLLVVIASEPAPDFFLTDRYVCAAELIGARACIVWNKTDLASEEPAELQEYERLSYPVLRVSAHSGEGITELAEGLGGGVSMLTGQSGVGKSSLINALTPAAAVAVNELSTASREGKHTTTASYMHELAKGGRLIDSPGVREFAPVVKELKQVQLGFTEIQSAADECRFADCLHLREPDCAVKAGVEAGTISARRYESYKRLCNTTSGLLENAR